MRTYGRVTNEFGNLVWVLVETDAGGRDDLVWATTVIQTLKLNLGESPFYANYGIPAHTSLVQQIAPDYYAVFTQQQYAQYFGSLIISRDQNARVPTYNLNITTNQGVQLTPAIQRSSAPQPPPQPPPIIADPALINDGGVLVSYDSRFPTSDAGLSPGSFWSNDGVITITTYVPVAQPLIVYIQLNTVASLLSLNGGAFLPTSQQTGGGILWNNGGFVCIS